MSLSSTKAHKRAETEFTTYRSWRSTEHASRATRGGQGRVPAEKQAGPGIQAFIRVHRWSALGFPGKPDWAIQTRKSRVLVSFAGVLSKGGRPGTWRLFITFTWDSAAVSRARSQEGSVSSKPCRSPATQKGTKAVILQSSSTKSSTEAFILEKLSELQVRMVGNHDLFSSTLTGSPSLSQ